MGTLDDREAELDRRDRKLEGALRAKVPFTSTGSGFMAKGSRDKPLTDYDDIGGRVEERTAFHELSHAYRDLGKAGRWAGPIEQLLGSLESFHGTHTLGDGDGEVQTGR